MTITREELAAFADGELDPAREAEIRAAVAADIALSEQLSAHRALRERLGAHFAPIFEAPLPGRLTAPLQPKVVDLAAAREQRAPARALPRWGWIVGPALAASLALAVFLPRGGGHLEGLLAETLDSQLTATQSADADPRILLSFRDSGGNYCRAFAGGAQSGIACRDAEGWRLRYRGESAVRQGGEYRKAGNSAAALLERAQAMANGPALDAAQEVVARNRGWLR